MGCGVRSVGLVVGCRVYFIWVQGVCLRAWRGVSFEVSGVWYVTSRLAAGFRWGLSTAMCDPGPRRLFCCF